MSHEDRLDRIIDREDEDEEEAEEEQDEYAQGSPRLPPWGIKKRVIRECPVADWDKGRPRHGDKVTVHFVAKLQDGTQVGSSHDTGKPFEFLVGGLPREIVVGMELAVLTMRPSEVAEFTIASRFAYDDLGSPPLVPPGATMVFEVELLSWELQLDIFGDGRAVKTVLREGTGDRKAERGDEVVLSLKCVDRRDRVFQEHVSIDHVVGDPIFGVLSRVAVNTVLSMVEGERCSVVLGWDVVTGDRKFRDGGTVDISLERLFEARDLSLAGDRSLVKKVLVEGRGEARPSMGSRVRLRVESATDGGDASVGTLAGPKTLEFSALAGEVCDALEFAVVEMREGERAELRCAPPLPQCAGSELGLAAVEVPRVHLTVELLGFSGVAGDPSAQPPAERFELAKEHKGLAGKHYTSQRYALALDLYRRAIASLPTGGEGSELGASQLAEEVEQFRRLCELNRAACRLKRRDFRGAREACEEVLRSEPTSEKALYRRASAHFGLSDYSAALRDLQQVLQNNPQNAEARALATQVREAKKQYGSAAKEAAARMLDTQDAAAAAKASGNVEAQTAGLAEKESSLASTQTALGSLRTALSGIPLPCFRC